MHRLVNGTDQGQVFHPVTEQISAVRGDYPYSTALSYGNRNLTYEALDCHAARFAGYLAELGVRPGETVAICMERSIDWIVAALGVMRAGVAYVPLDQAWPDSRLRFAIEDSGASALVARTETLDRLQVKPRGVDPSRDADVIAASPVTTCVQLQPDDLAYVIYTSGSTGVPKGVEITHANLNHLIRWHQHAFDVTQQDRASHLAGLGFDAAVWEIWPHLAAGGTVCLAEDIIRASPELMREWMIRERITIGFVPTVHAAAMMAMEWPSATSLRLLLTGGDALPEGPPVQLPFDVFNNYGPTECTVVATSSPLKAGTHGTPPIGRPVAGTSIYLLDEDGKQVPYGSVGEIYIGGNGVGRGYRNLPDLTERNFLPDPFSETLGYRMYRTGDRGARRPDGEIEFLGRLDRQTKICGQRVELDEIGSVLARHPDVAFAVAVVTNSPKGDKQLVAHVLPKENAAVPTAGQLRDLLLRSLPDYMIPTVFARLHQLPLSVNGKVDLNLLPQSVNGQLLEGAGLTAEAKTLEEKLLITVRTLLENDTVGAEDSFFLAGGHSLLGTQLVMRVRGEFGVDLTLRQLFEAPTVKRLASLVETIRADFDPASGQTTETQVRPGQVVGPSELSQNSVDRQQAEPTHRKINGNPQLPPGVITLQPRGSRNSIFWLDYVCADLANVIGNDQPFISVAFTAQDFSSIGDEATMKSIAACALRKVMAVQPKGPYTIGGYCRGGIIAYETASQLRAAGEEVALLVLVDAPNPSYIQSRSSIKRKIRYLNYAVRRSARIGIRQSLIYLCDRLPRFVTHLTTRSANVEMAEVDGMLQAATLAYRPGIYDGKVLLLLASEHPPDANFPSGWRAVVPNDLREQYIDGHHRDLLRGRNASIVAESILSCLAGSDAPSRALPNTTSGPTT